MTLHTKLGATQGYSGPMDFWLVRTAVQSESGTGFRPGASFIQETPENEPDFEFVMENTRKFMSV